MMLSKLALAAALGLMMTMPAPALAQHESDVRMTGVATLGTSAYLASVVTSGTYTNYRVTLRDPVGGVVLDTTFFGSMTQNGLDADPIPEVFRRTITDTQAGVDFQLDGGMVQYELFPTAWVHAYVGHYSAYDLKLVVVQAAGRFVQV
jgi:hypothetical protein